MHRPRHRGLIVGATLAICSLLSTSAAAHQTLRVAILKGSNQFKMSGVDLIIRDAQGRDIELPDTFDRDNLKIRPRKNGIAVNEYVIPATHITISAPSVYYRLERRQYRGAMHVWNEGGKLLAVNHVDLEEYLVGLINHEINSEWPMPAVKAQAVVARTYALYQAANARDERYDLESTVADQVYAGAQTEDWRSARAVRETSGEVIVTKDGALIQAYYHSCCGGRTELPENVWGTKTAVAHTVKDPFCRNSPKFSWTYTIEPAELGRRLRNAGHKGGFVNAVKVMQRTPSGRALKIRIESTEGAVVLGGNELRRAIGYSQLASANFHVDTRKGKFVFTGKGAGHGVGLCQWGAKGMGDSERYTYRQILGFYYPKLYIRNLYKSRRSASASD